MTLGLVPVPARVRELEGRWQPGSSEPQVATGAEPVAELARELLGFVPNLVLAETAEAEAYELRVDGDGPTITAGSAVGLRNGLQTLRQLWVADGVPYVEIEDVPRLPWRGAMLDVARWFVPMDYLHRFVDVLAVHKFNRFHLHLTDDQGWRIEIARYPRLTTVGSQRAGSQVGHARDGVVDDVPHGGFYTQEELRALVNYAADRGVEIVPEIDFPGHVTAALAAYPELGNRGEPVEVARQWGIHTGVLNAEESTLRFCADVLDEVMDIFPAPWVHLGGDECPVDEWIASERAAQRAAELGLSGPERLQDWFSAALTAHVRSRGRTAIVWDEALAGELHPETVVMAWRKAEYGRRAAERGHQVIMVPQQSVYLDWYQDDGPDEPLAIGGLTTLDDVIAFDPYGPNIIGTQGMLWSEYLPTTARIEDMAYPRLAAIADIAWSGAGAPGLRERLHVHQQRLEAMGVRGRPISS